MTVARGFGITIASGVAFAAVGGLLGYALGAFAPNYYRTVFRVPPGGGFNPVQTGLGLGLTQGLAAGLLIGLVIVVAVAWFDGRTIHRST